MLILGKNAIINKVHGLTSTRKVEECPYLETSGHLFSTKNERKGLLYYISSFHHIHEVNTAGKMKSVRK